MTDTIPPGSKVLMLDRQAYFFFNTEKSRAIQRKAEESWIRLKYCGLFFWGENIE